MKEDEILVKIYAASLNYREMLMAQVKIFLCSISFSLSRKDVSRVALD